MLEISVTYLKRHSELSQKDGERNGRVSGLEK